MRSSFLRALRLLALVFLSSAPADGKTRATPPPITTLAGLSDVWLHKSPSVPFAVRGQITCLVLHSERSYYITLSDGKERTFLSGSFSGGCVPFRRGDHVLVSGMTASKPGGRVSKLEVLRSAQPPPPVPVGARDLGTPACHWLFARLTGVVRDVRPSETNNRWALLLVATDDGPIHVSLPTKRPLHAETPLSSLRDLIGQRVEIDGFPSPRSRSPRQYLTMDFLCGGREEIRLVAPVSDDPFRSADISTMDLLSPERIAATGFVRTKGVVVTTWRGKNALVRDAKGKVTQLVVDGSDLPPPGAAIEAAGIPHTDLINLTLSHARWRSLDTADGPAAAAFEPPVDLPQPSAVMNGSLIWNLHGKTVRAVGRVYGVPRDDPTVNTLLLDCGGHLFNIEVNPSVDLAQVEVGCTLEVTGTYVLQSELWQPESVFPRIRDFLIVVSARPGIRVLARPPWWTPQRLTFCIGALLALLVGILVWNQSLRRLATRKSRELFREQIGHVKADLRTEERTHLAVELHDTLAQNLTGVSMEIEAASELRGNAPQPMLDHLHIAALALKSCRDELRNCLWDLRSQALEEKDMTKAILRTLQPHVSDSRLAVRFDLARALLSDNRAHALLRIIRELVVNAIRHGEATSVRIAGAREGERLLVSVTDNGRGFDPDAAPGVLQGHFGLQGIRERLNELDGEMRIESSASSGTRVIINLPLSREKS